jgi:hypothetical protein
VFEWGSSITIGKRSVSTCRQQCIQNRKMIRAAITKHNGFDNCCPVQIVYMVQGLASGD